MTAPTHHRCTSRRRVPVALAASLTAAGLVLLACSAPADTGAAAPPTTGAGSSTTSATQSPNPPSSSPGAVVTTGGSVSGSSDASTPSAPGTPLAGAASGSPVSPSGSAPAASSTPPASSTGTAAPAASGVPAPGTTGQPDGPVVPGQPGSSGNASPGGPPGSPANPGNAAPGDTGAGSGISGAARRAAIAAAPTLPPLTLSIPALGVGPAPIGPTCSESDTGVLEPPVNAQGMLCTWRGSAPPAAESGETSVAGHINYGQIPGAAFAKLSQMRPGDPIYLRGATGGTQVWITRTTFERSKALPLDDTAFLGPDGPRSLALISCGGPLIPGARSYANNVYVFASPA